MSEGKRVIEGDSVESLWGRLKGGRGGRRRSRREKGASDLAASKRVEASSVKVNCQVKGASRVMYLVSSVELRPLLSGLGGEGGESDQNADQTHCCRERKKALAEGPSKAATWKG